MKPTLALLFLSFLCIYPNDLKLHAQCNPPDQLPGAFCQDAPLICLLNACYETLLMPNDGPSGWCFGNNTIENPQYFLFYPIANNVEIHIYVEYCDSGTALQAGILNDCPWTPSNVLACDGGAFPGETIILYTENVIPGEPYWLMFDGSSGSLCNYTITYVNNIYTPEFTEELESAEAIPYEVCLGADALVLEAYPSIALAHGYAWILGWSGDTVTSTLSSTTVSVPNNIDPGIYEICVYAFSGCDTSQTVCFEVDVFETLIGERDPIILCPEEFPISWGPLAIEEAGTYIRSFSEAGCEFDSMWIVESYPVPEMTIIDTVYCLPENEFSFYYENEPYDNSGIYTLYYPKSDVNGCDSFAELNLLMIGINAYAEIICENGELELTVLVEEVFPFFADVEFNWYNKGDNVLLYEGNPFQPSLPGCYEVYIDVITNDHTCSYLLSDICVTNAQFPSPPELNFSDTAVCANQTLTLCIKPGGSMNEYHWSIPPGAEIIQNPGGCIELDLSDCPGGQICVSSSNECGTSVPVCRTISVSHDIASPNLNCTSTVNSIDFFWDIIPGAEGYQVSVNGNPMVPAGTDTAFTMLPPGTSIELIVQALNVPPCANTSDTLTCISIDCPLPVIELTGTDSFCLNNPTVATLEAQVNGSPGTGSWSGPGIIDGNSGLFDPKVAGAGDHQLIYSVSEGGCSFNQQYPVFVSDSITSNFELDPEICVFDVVNVQYSGNASTNAFYAFDFNPAQIISGSGQGPFQLQFNAPGIYPLSLIASENGCSSEPFVNTIIVHRQLEPPAYNCYSAIDSLAIEWFMDTLAQAGLVNILSGHTGDLTGNLYSFTGLAEGEIVEIELITQSNGPCPGRTDTISCVAKSCPPVEITLEPVAKICLDGNAQDIDLEVAVLNGNGTGYWSGPGIIDSINGVFNPQTVASGSHIITYHYFDECEFESSITIEVFDPPIAVISNTSLELTCGQPVILLDASLSTGNTLNFNWTTSNGNILNGSDSMVAEVNKAGEYQLIVTDLLSGCADSVMALVTQDSNIPVADAGPDKILTCDSISVNLGGPSDQGIDIIYEWTTPDGNIIGSSDKIYTTVNNQGTYTITLLDTITGCTSSDQVIVGIDTATSTITFTEIDTIDCNTTDVTVAGILNEPEENYNFLWSTLDGKIEGDKNLLSVKVTQGGTYQLMITKLSNGCQKTAAIFIPESDDIIQELVIDHQNISCFGSGDGAIHVIDVVGGTGPYDYLWMPVLTNGPQIQYLEAGDYYLTVSDANGCIIEEKFVIVEPSLITTELGENLTVEVGDSVHIHLNTNLDFAALYSVEWNINGQLACSDCIDLNFKAEEASVIIATVTDTLGCAISDTVLLTVLFPRDVYIPNIFSPNGDGISDFFTISGNATLKGIGSLKIYDRWGNLLYNRSEFDPGIPALGWDGSFRQEPALPGVYVYVAELVYLDFRETVWGNITLVR